MELGMRNGFRTGWERRGYVGREGNQKLNLDEDKTSANIHEARSDSGEDGSSEKLQTWSLISCLLLT